MGKKTLSVIDRIKKWCKGYDLEQMLGEISVSQVDAEHAELNNIPGLLGWFYVTDTDGVNSYHSTEKEACRARLDIINRVLND